MRAMPRRQWDWLACITAIPQLSKAATPAISTGRVIKEAANVNYIPR